MNFQYSPFNIHHRMFGRLLGVFAAGTVLAASTSAEQTNSFPPRSSFDIIQTRNIFNPNRRQDFVYDPHQTVVRPRTQAFALVGTMSYEKGQFAFFDGSDSQYKKVLEPGGNIAGYTVKNVTQTNVTLTANGKDFSMPVGAQMRNQGPNKWQLSGHIIEEPTTEATNGETAAAEPTTPPTGSSPEMSDVLKRLMQNRQQELK